MEPTCGCYLAKPAAFMGLSTFHSSLCMHNAEARFCMPTAPLKNAMLIRAQSDGEDVEARRMALQAAAVESVSWSTRPPKSSAPIIQKQLTMKWDLMHRLSEREP